MDSGEEMRMTVFSTRYLYYADPLNRGPSAAGMTQILSFGAAQGVADLSRSVIAGPDARGLVRPSDLEKFSGGH